MLLVAFAIASLSSAWMLDNRLNPSERLVQGSWRDHESQLLAPLELVEVVVYRVGLGSKKMQGALAPDPDLSGI